MSVLGDVRSILSSERWGLGAPLVGGVVVGSCSQ